MDALLYYVQTGNSMLVRRLVLYSVVTFRIRNL